MVLLFSIDTPTGWGAPPTERSVPAFFFSTQNPMRYVVYDLEIRLAIPTKGAKRQPGVKYCKGWGDHAGMGISCLGAYDSDEERFRVFFEDNRHEFEALAEAADLLVGFNNIRFDDKVLKASDWEIPWDGHGEMGVPRYDILAEMLKGKKLGPDTPNSRTGHDLSDCAERNFGVGKTGRGADSPVDFQRGRWGKLVDHCLEDVWLTQKLFECVLRDGKIRDPRHASRKVKMADPRKRVRYVEEE